MYCFTLNPHKLAISRRVNELVVVETDFVVVVTFDVNVGIIGVLVVMVKTVVFDGKVVKELNYFVD